MLDNGNNEVFNRRIHTCAATEVPAPGTDNHTTIDSSNRVWNGITNAPFIKHLSSGQEQQLVLSADHFYILAQKTKSLLPYYRAMNPEFFNWIDEVSAR